MPSPIDAPARRPDAFPAASRTPLVVLLVVLALFAAGALYVVTLTSARTPFDPWWRHLQSVERQIGRLKGIDQATLEVETPVFHNRTLRGDWPPARGTLSLELDETTDQARLLELLPETHQLITAHDWPVEHGHRIGPSDGSSDLGFPVDPRTWTVIVTSEDDRLEAAEGPLSLMPDARLWTDGARAVTDRLETDSGYGTESTSLVGYRSVDTDSVSSVEEFMAARKVVPDDVDLIGPDGNITLIAYGQADNPGFTAADIVAGTPLGQAEGVRAVDIGYGREGEGLGFWAETRDDFGAHLVDPLPESTVRLASGLHEQLTDRRVPHHIMIQDQAYIWPAQKP